MPQLREPLDNLYPVGKTIQEGAFSAAPVFRGGREMELKTKDLFLSTIDGVMSVRRDCGLETGRTGALKDAVQNMPLLVPVVCEFSAGKSSLLNTMMGKDVLAVAMDPESAIPAELYYSDTEYDEGVREAGSTERITDIAGAADCLVCPQRSEHGDYGLYVQGRKNQHSGENLLALYLQA